MKNKLMAKVTSIAECIYSQYSSVLYVSQNWGLYNGNCGIVLFLFYYAKYTKDYKYAELAESLLVKLLDNSFHNISLSSFSGGLSGVLYFFEFLREHDFVDIDVSEYKDDIEQYLVTYMQREIKKGQYDFMHGAIGIGLYFLKARLSVNNIQVLTDYLYETAEKDFSNRIFKWKSIIDYDKNEMGYNISLSHGISSIIIFLSRLIQANICNNKILSMQEGAVNYILSQEYHMEETLSQFPSQSLENTTYTIQNGYSRLAWCYGDLGIGLALLQAGRSIKNIKWIEKGLQVLEGSTVRRNLYQNYVIDAGICHGSAGIAMIYNRLYLDTNRSCFLMASQYWYNVTFEMASFENEIAGYKTYLRGEWMSDYSLLTGVSGIGLSLLSYLYEDRQEWDEIFLLT